MKFTDIFIRRPVLAIVISLIILLAGLQSLRSLLLNVRQYPRSDATIISITTTYTGASAELIRSHITIPMEKAIASVDGIDYMESSSAQGISIITVHLRLNLDVYKALTDIQTKITQVRNHLPPEAETPVIDVKTGDSQTALLYLSFYSKNLDSGQITDFLNRVIQPKLTALNGVQKAEIFRTQAPLPGADQFPIEFVIGAPAKPQEILTYAQNLIQGALKSGLFSFIETDLKYDQPEYQVHFDRDKVSTLGVDLQRSGRELNAMLAGNYVTRFSHQGHSYKVIPQIKRVHRLNPDQLSDIYMSSKSGKLVKLSTFTHISHSAQPRELKRFQQLNSVTVQGVLIPGVSIEEGLSLLEHEARRILPPGYVIDYGGESRQLRKEGNQLLITMVLSLILIFLVLAAQFESFRDPLIVLLGSAPLALAGALLIPFMGWSTLNIYTQIGMITLIGLITKNGILIVEFANKLQDSGLDKFQAVVEAAGIRLRPILMTALATVLGSLPLVLLRGPGAGARNSIGIVIVSGMVIGTFFSLFFVPAIYTFVAQARRKTPLPQLLSSLATEDAPQISPQPVTTLNS